MRTRHAGDGVRAAELLREERAARGLYDPVGRSDRVEKRRSVRDGVPRVRPQTRVRHRRDDRGDRRAPPVRVHGARPALRAAERSRRAERGARSGKDHTDRRPAAAHHCPRQRCRLCVAQLRAQAVRA